MTTSNLITLSLMTLMLMGTVLGSVQVHHQTDYLFNELPQEKIEQMKIPEDQTLIVRLPSNTLLKYTSYKDVSILHFRIPPDTRTAFFTFKAVEESKSAFQRKCKPRDVTLHLKASSYPVISPENITFPRNFLSSDQRFKTYNLQFESNELQQRITVEGPQIGNWFAVAFVSWTDPNNDRIEQQGLAASCDTLLLAEMSVSRFHPIIINNGQVHNGNITSNSIELQRQQQQQPQLRQQQEQERERERKAKQQNANATTRTPDNIVTSDEAQPNDNRNPSYAAQQQQLQQQNQQQQQEQQQQQHQKPHSHFASQVQSLSGHDAEIEENAKRAEYTKTRSGRNDGNDTDNKSTTNNEIIYKFYVPPEIGVATARISFAQVCLHCPDIGLYIQPNAYPSTSRNQGDGDVYNYVHNTAIKPNQTDEISIEFYVQPSVWHYAVLKFVSAAYEEIKEGDADVGGSATTHSVMNIATLLALDGRLRGGSDSSLEHRLRLRRQNGSKSVAKTNETIWYNVQYTLQIDYHEPVNEVNDGETSNLNATNTRDKQNASNSTTSNAHENANASTSAWRPVRFRDMEFYPLLRQTYREFFMFDYDLVPDSNGTVPAVLNMTAGTPAGFTFELGEVYDIGGTLSFAVSMKHGPKTSSELKAMPTTSSLPERTGILAEKLIAPESQDDTDVQKATLPRSNQTIIVCMRLGEPGVPTWPDKCRYGRRLLPASSIVNNTDSNTSTGLVHVPFPESGQWYVTMGLYCHGAETARVTIIDSVKEFVRQHASLLKSMNTPCACANAAEHFEKCINDRACLAAMNETDTLKVKECMMDSKCTADFLEMTRRFEVHHKSATEQHFALDNCNTSVVFTVSSSPCVAGRCGRFGRCYHYMSGGFVFSTCVCMKGYRGWDCTEDSQVPSSMSILAASLLLTLSNLLFFPSIYMALRRRYYTEAVIYFFAMFFSIFYHACDSGEDEYSFCLVKIGVLQFCDFYCGLLAIWVTLVAMAHIRPQFVSLLHMLGAILLAFGTELNKQSLWVFLAPALTGICLISTSWGLRCYKTRKWFPARRYLTVFMPLGAVLVMVGLVCYAFLQTKQNYHIVHSVWHMVMALSILCLLPSRKSFAPKC